jgi:serine/threonine-protein kinase
VIGERFGSFQALSLLGEGGMGSVYLAEHPTIGRRVAVKVLRTELGRDPEVLERFLNEARAANAIRHPNIIEILDSGTTAAGVPYLVMELLEGETLRARMARAGGPLPLRDALEIAYQTASALGAAHAKGIVHRDLKPDNLFLVPNDVDPGRERVKVLDFGIAKLQIDRAGSFRTRTGALMGTPVYMSPEQCLGTKTVDLRTDVYALGIILFEMLTGSPPYLSDGFGELVNMHLNATIPSPREKIPDVPEAIASLVVRMLAKRPEDRVASMADVQAAIKAAASPSLQLRGLSSSPRLDPTAPTTAREVAAPTTLSRTAGELERPAGARSGRRGVTYAAIGLAVVAGALAAARLRGGSSPEVVAATPSLAPAAPPPKAVDTVELRIDSDPPGADVAGEGGVRIGTTPIVTTRPRAAGTLELTLSKAGFRPARIQVPLDKNRESTVELRPEEAAPTASPARKPTRRPAVRKPSGEDPGELAPAKL